MIQTSLSTIIICRFHLTLQERNQHPNGSLTQPSAHLSSFRAAVKTVHNAVLDEFGDLRLRESLRTGTSEDDQEIAQPNADDQIEYQKPTCSTRDISDMDITGPVA